MSLYEKKNIIELSQNNLLKLFHLDITIISILLVGIIEILGILILKWNIQIILTLFFVESVIIIFFSIIKIGIKDIKHIFYAIFPAIIILIILFIYIATIINWTPFEQEDESIKFILSIMRDNYFMIFLIFLSHCLSFFINFIVKKEYKEKDLNKLTKEGFTRIILILLVLFIPTIIAWVINSKILNKFIYFFILLKIIVDIYAYSRERKV